MRLARRLVEARESAPWCSLYAVSGDETWLRPRTRGGLSQGAVDASLRGVDPCDMAPDYLCGGLLRRGTKREARVHGTTVADQVFMRFRFTASIKRKGVEVREKAKPPHTRIM